MAKKKTTANTNGSHEVITKKEAVDRVLRQHGMDLPPLEIQSLVKDQFGLDLTIAHVYNLKSTLGKDASGKKPGKKKRKRRGGRRRKAQAETQPVLVARASNGKNQGGLSLKEIEAVKELKSRLGAKSLHSLIDMLG